MGDKTFEFEGVGVFVADWDAGVSFDTLNRSKESFSAGRMAAQMGVPSMQERDLEAFLREGVPLVLHDGVAIHGLDEAGTKRLAELRKRLGTKFPNLYRLKVRAELEPLSAEETEAAFAEQARIETKEVEAEARRGGLASISDPILGVLRREDAHYRGDDWWAYSLGASAVQYSGAMEGFPFAYLVSGRRAIFRLASAPDRDPMTDSEAWVPERVGKLSSDANWDGVVSFFNEVAQEYRSSRA